MPKPRILIQLDGDAQPSVFDGVVAVDAGIEHIFRHGIVAPDGVRVLVHGAIFTRGLDELARTALFVGGSDVGAGERLLDEVRGSFFGPFRVSVMMDANGANTTAAAAVLAAAKHVDLAAATALVLAGTGPVGARASRLLAGQGAHVRVASRRLDRAQAVCESIASKVAGAKLSAVQTASDVETAAALSGADVVIAAGAAGAELLSADARKACRTLKAAIDLNAVPPVGLAGVDPGDRGKDKGGVACYGAIGIGGTKMKIHKAALRRLYKQNDLVLDAEEIFQIGRDLLA